MRSLLTRYFLSFLFLTYLPTIRYYVTAAPQCVFPDAALGGVLNTATFDAIYGKVPCILRIALMSMLFLQSSEFVLTVC